MAGTPFASFLTTVGFAKQNATTYLTAAVAAAATSIPVNGTVVPASSTIFFIDGVNSESKAVSAGGGSSTLTTAATTFAHPANTPIVYQLTAGLGAVDWMPVTGVTLSDTIADLPDQGIRGSNVSTYNVAQGTMSGQFSINGDVFPDTIGYLLGGVFGAVDFSGGTPNVHTFAAMNTAASNGQPTPLLTYIFNGNNTRMFSHAKCSSLQLTFDPAGLLKYTSSWMGFGSAVVANASSPTFGALPPQGAWQASTSINGVTLPNVLSADFTIKRDSMAAIQTIDGSQQPFEIWAGGLSITGNIKAVMLDDTLLAFFLGNTQPTVIFTLTNGTGASQVQLQLQMTKCQFTNGWAPTITGGNGYVEIGGPVTAVANVTDSNTSGTGYSPGRVVLKNAKASGTYQ